MVWNMNRGGAWGTKSFLLRHVEIVGEGRVKERSRSYKRPQGEKGVKKLRRGETPKPSLGAKKQYISWSEKTLDKIGPGTQRSCRWMIKSMMLALVTDTGFAGLSGWERDVEEKISYFSDGW